MSERSENDYMQQVMANQQQVEVALKAKRGLPAPANRMAVANYPQARPMMAGVAELRQSERGERESKKLA